MNEWMNEYMRKGREKSFIFIRDCRSTFILYMVYGKDEDYNFIDCVQSISMEILFELFF